jgi:hypothetical protein
MKLLFQTLLILFVSAVCIFAQGEDAGVPKSKPKPPKTKVSAVPKKPSKTPSKVVPKSAATKIVKRPTVKKSDKIQYGSLQISVNERDSRIFLSGDSGNPLDEDSIEVVDETSPVIIEDLQTGSYTVTIRKAGFFDAEQKIFITGGKVNAVSLLLKPSAALLSVRTDTDGAIIEIENVGEFENPAENIALAPGVYQVNAFKDGFISETKRIEIGAAGQKSAIDFALKPIPVERLINDAQASFNRRDYQAAIKSCLQVLSAEPTHRKANLLAGESYFKLSNPRDGAFLVSRAIGAGEQFAVPVRVYKKEKNNLQLPSGNLIVNRTAIQFESPPTSDLNFYLLKTDISELLEKVDEFGITYISLKAKGTFGGKTEKRTVRIYSDQTVVKSSKKDLMCPNCNPTSCLCRSSAQAVYEIVNRWQTSDFTGRRSGFSAVMLPSQNFVSFQADGFSIKLPENWQALIGNNEQILASPPGGFEEVENSFSYSHGVDAIAVPNPNAISLSQLTDNFLRLTVEKNSYLNRGTSSESNLRGNRILINRLTGFSSTTQRDENIAIYTLLIPSNKTFLAISTVTPPDEGADYKDTFRRILNSLKFSK